MPPVQRLIITEHHLTASVSLPAEKSNFGDKTVKSLFSEDGAVQRDPPPTHTVHLS